PLEAMIDRQVPGVGDWHAVVACIQTILRASDAARRRSASGRLQVGDLTELNSLLPRQAVVDDVLRGGQRSGIIVVLSSKAIDAPASANHSLAGSEGIIGHTKARRD